jgi:hypothetical protein
MPITRSISVTALALCIGAASLAAQEPGNGNFQWYVGAHGGAMAFRTPSQTRGGIPIAGGHLLVVARRTGLMLSVEEGIGDTELTSYTTGSGSSQAVTFNDIRKYSATLMGFPFRTPIQPFFGVGVGIMHVVNPYTGSEEASVVATELGSTGFGSFVGGVQFKVARFMGFGQYQITTSPSRHATLDFGGGVATGNLLAGPTHTFTAGLRIGLGGARDRASTGGY